ncbi:MAG: hypothetical protein EP297_09470 [Gammaproteobacteria bacterium]|nr:MAG: hypothetical protein EP297_09470 [Gammaproteobacteria bacterium]
MQDTITLPDTVYSFDFLLHKDLELQIESGARLDTIKLKMKAYPLSDIGFIYQETMPGLDEIP